MQPILALAVFIAPILLIGAAICAWMHGLGFKKIVKAPRHEIPTFSRRLGIQILYLALICLFGFLLFGQLNDAPLTDIFTSRSLFAPTKTGALQGMIFSALTALCSYLVIVSGLTKLLTKFRYVETLQSLIIVMVVSAALYAAMIGYSYKAFLGALPDEMPKATLGTGITSNANGDKTAQSPEKSENLDGIWIIDEQNSKLYCTKIADETTKLICHSAVDSAAIALAGSDGILVRNNVLQDGPNLCNLEVRNEEGFRYSCINPLDRSIYARVNFNPDGTLTFSAALTHLILAKKK